MGIIKFIFEIIKKYLGLIITLLMVYIIYKSYYAVDNVSVKGGYYTLYNTLGKAINFVFDNIPKILIEIPNVNIPKFGYIFDKVGSIPEVGNIGSISINKPSNCGFKVPNPWGLAKCGLAGIYEGGKYVVKGASAAVNAIGGAAKAIFCITEDSLILMSDKSTKKIKDLKIGDEILNITGNINKIFYIHKEKIDKQIEVYGINDIECFFSDTHPIVSGLDKDIVLSINPKNTLLENPERVDKIKKLEIGDIILINNEKVTIDKITKKTLNKNSFVYDLMFEDMNDISYIANNIAIESQEPNYIKNSPIIGYIIIRIAYIYYDKRKDKTFIEEIIKKFVNINNKYINDKKHIKNAKDILELKLFANNSLKFILNKIKNDIKYIELGHFINELWVKYYNLLTDFEHIKLEDINNLEF